MKIRRMTWLLYLPFFIAQAGCRQEEEPGELLCTSDLKYFTLKVSGSALTDFYTIRLSNSDTIRHTANVDLKQNVYLVLDDRYREKLENQQDTFRFIGKRGNGIAVQEDYVFQADHCHISKVSGASEI